MQEAKTLLYIVKEPKMVSLREHINHYNGQLFTPHLSYKWLPQPSSDMKVRAKNDALIVTTCKRIVGYQDKIIVVVIFFYLSVNILTS